VLGGTFVGVVYISAQKSLVVQSHDGRHWSDSMLVKGVLQRPLELQRAQA
jgi:hypothetical protein